MSFTLRFAPPTFLFGFAPLAGLLGRAPAPRRRIEPTLPARVGTAPDDGVDRARLLAAARKAPQLDLLEWDGDRVPAMAEPGEACDDPHTFKPARRRIRDRYIEARFPGVARCSADLANAPGVVKAARLMFEDGQHDLALELLELAAEEAPQQSALWLARVEILFLARDRDGFVAAARAFRAVHRFSDAWDEVARLGRAIAPGEALFGAVAGPRDHEHYGPWPHLPNWIDAPWDLTAEVTAAEFHHALR
jgi:hypothetical protein